MSSRITSNTFCNYSVGEQMKVGYGLTLCLLIQFLIPTDTPTPPPRIMDNKSIVVILSIAWYCQLWQSSVPLLNVFDQVIF